MKKYKGLLITWVLSLILFVLSIYIGGVRNGRFDENPSLIKDIALIMVGVSILVGVVSFLIFIYRFIKNNTKKNDDKKRDKLKTFLRFLFIAPAFPIYQLVITIKSFFKSKPRLKDNRWLIILVDVALLVPLWLLAYTVTYYVSTDELVLGTRYQVTVAKDSPSMTPSFPGNGYIKYYPYKNIFYKLNKKWSHKFQRGDVILFSTPVTNKILALKNENGGYVKRAVGLPGETVEIKGGAVFINNKYLEEPYTLESNSTFPLYDDYEYLKQNSIEGLFLKECQKITVPDSSLFVLGDNRKNSEDSRTIGFVRFDDINGFLTLEVQKKPYYEGVTLVTYTDKWRDASSDYNNLLKSSKIICK